MKWASLLLLVLGLVVTARCARQRPIDPRSPQMFAAYVASSNNSGDNEKFDKAVARLIRAGRYGAAERELLLLIDGAPASDLKKAVLATSWSDIRFFGWEEVLTRLDPAVAAARKRAALARSRSSGFEAIVSRIYDPLITAIGIDVSGHAVQNLQRPADRMVFEVSYYSDHYFPFSSSDRAAILAHSETYGTDWQGNFVDIDTALSVSGMTPLMLALEQYATSMRIGKSRENRAVRNLATWWAFLAVERALAREMKRLSLPRSVPFLLGTHDFGGYITTVHDPRR